MVVPTFGGILVIARATLCPSWMNTNLGLSQLGGLHVLGQHLGVHLLFGGLGEGTISLKWWGTGWWGIR